MKVGMSSNVSPKPIKTGIKSSNILEEINKFRMLKSQGVLNSVPTDSTVESPTYHMMSKSAFQPLTTKLEEERRLSNSHVVTTSTSKSPQKNDSFTTPKKGSSYNKQNSTPHLYSPPSSIKRSPSNSVASLNQRSPKSFNLNNSLARNHSDLSLISNKSNKMTYSAFTMADADTDLSILSNVREKYSEPDNLDDSRLKTILKKPAYSESSRSSPFRPEATLKSWDNKFTAPKKRYSNLDSSRNRITSAEKIITNSKAEFKPKITRKAESTEKTPEIQELIAEVERWRGFGKDMAKAYNELNQKFRQFTSNKSNNVSNSTVLNQQVVDLRKELTKYQNENAKMKFTTSPVVPKMEPHEFQKKSAQLREKIDNMKKENQNAKATLEFLKDENEILQKSTVDIKKYKAESEYYKSLTEAKFKECSTLAEEVIELRAQLDRSHSNYLKFQRSRTENLNSEGDLEVKTRPRESSLKKDKSITSPNKKGVKWKDELIEKSPRATSQSMRATR